MSQILKVSLESPYGSFYAAIDVPDICRKEFQPLRTCDDAIISMITDSDSGEAAEIVIRARKDAAKILANDLAEVIVKAMERNDTHNGYKKFTA